MHHRFLPWWVLIWLGVFGAALSLGSRVKREMRPSPVEIAVEWSDVTRCASAWGIPSEVLLRDLRQEGVRGVVCDFASARSLSDDGRLTLMTRPEVESVFPSMSRVSTPYSFAIITRDASLFAQIKQWYQVDQKVAPLFFTRSAERSGSPPLYIMALPLAPRAITLWPLGFDPEQVSTVHAAGLEPVARMENPDDTSPLLLEAMMKAANGAGARLWLPHGQVPGYSTLLPWTAYAMRQHRLALAFMEFDNALGVGDLASDAQGWVVRGHAVGVLDTSNMQRGELLDRYTRAVRERNARLLIVRIRRQSLGDGIGVSSRAQNREFFAALKSEITADPLPWRGLRTRLQLGLAQPVGIYTTSERKAFLARCCAGVGVLGAAMLLLSLALDLSHRRRFIWGAVGLGLVSALSISPNWGAKISALLAAIVFPLVALLWSGLGTECPRLTRRSAIQRAVGVLVRVTGLSLAGGLVIAAVLGHWTFHVKIADFWGTKAAGVVPIVLACGAMAGDFWPRRVEQFGAPASWRCLAQRLRVWAAMPFPLRSILLGALTLGVVSLWLARTGNDSGIAVSPLEWKFRAILESQLIARPRTKEFLLCHPALLLGALAWMGQKKRLGFGLLLLGLIGQISVVNSFTQANNPLYIPFWRTLLSLALAIAVGAVLAWYAAPGWHFASDEKVWGGWKWLPRFAAGAALLALLAGSWITWNRRRVYAELTALVPQATWPWSKAQHEILAPGIEHWFDSSSSDGTTLDLLSFDFAADRRLRFELFDSDLAASGNSPHPPNRFAYWNNGLGATARQLNTKGDLIAAWNGGYWGLLNLKPRTVDRSFHLSPVVYRGQVFYPGINRRWTWGAKIVGGRPVFSLQHTPSLDQMRREFDFGTGTLQALLVNGKPLEISAYPWFGEKPPPLGLPSTPAQAGTISVLDQMHTSRLGAGWTRSGRLFVLVVKEPDGEAASRAAVGAWKRGRGGWTLRDHQNFWLAMQKAFGIQNAVGLDGGDVAQALFRRPNGDFTLLVPRITLPETEKATLRLSSDPQFDAPPVKNLNGSALNYFIVRQLPN